METNESTGINIANSPSIDDQTTPESQEWENPPTLSELQADFENSKPYFNEQKVRRQRLLDNLEAVNNLKKVKGRSNIQPRTIKRHAEWRYPKISEPFNKNKNLVVCNPRTWDDTAGAEQNQAVLNYQWDNELNRVRYFDSLTRYVVDTGVCFTKVEWEAQEGEVERVEYEYAYHIPTDPETQQRLAETVTKIIMSPDLYYTLPPEIKGSVDRYKETGELLVARVVNTRKVTKTELVVNRPVLTNTNIAYVDPSSNGDIDKAGFIIFPVEVSYGSLKAEGFPDENGEFVAKYSNLDRVKKYSENMQVNTDTPYTTEDKSTERFIDNTFEYSDVARKKMTMYEYWGYYDIDGDGTLKPIVASWVGNILIRLEESPFEHGKIPVVPFSYLFTNESYYGGTDGELTEDNQKIIGAVTRSMVDIIGRTAANQRGIPEGMFQGDQLIKFNNNEDFRYNPSFNKEHIIQGVLPELPQSAFQMIQYMNTDADSLTGIKSFAGGEGLSGKAYGSTATSTRGVLDATELRNMAILRRISDSVIKVCKLICSLNQQFLEEDYVVRITNEKFVKVRKDNLKANFDIKMDIATVEEDKQRAGDLQFIMQTMGAKLPDDMKMKMLAKIARLSNMPDLEHDFKTWQPTPNPIAEETAKANLEAIKANNALVLAQAEREKADAWYTMNVRPQVESARKASLEANADKTRITTQEDVSGIAHNRELEKQEQKDNATKARQDALEDGRITSELLEKTLNTGNETNTNTGNENI